MTITVPVVGGKGDTQILIGANGNGFSLVSPDNTPGYSIEIYKIESGNEYFIAGGKITAQYAELQKPWSIRGMAHIYIYDALDDGNYFISPGLEVKR